MLLARRVNDDAVDDVANKFLFKVAAFSCHFNAIQYSIIPIIN